MPRPIGGLWPERLDPCDVAGRVTRRRNAPGCNDGGLRCASPSYGLVLVDACLGGSQNDALSALKNGDIMGVGAVISDGVPRFVGRSRKTPEATRKAIVAECRIPQSISGEH